MKQDRLSFSDLRTLRQSPLFSFLTAAFLCGVLAGSIVGTHIPRAETNYIHDLAALLSSSASGQTLSAAAVVSCLLSTFVWPAAVLIFGACRGRMVWTAMILALRGSLLSFAVSAALAASGLRGIYISVVSIGASALFWIPAMLFLGTAVLDAGMRKKYGYTAALEQHTAVLICCVALFILSVLWRMAAVPILLRIGA